MTFTPEQRDALSADLRREHVKSRTQSGRSLSYIEGWHAIAEANRIFGFDAWTRETIDIRCVNERERAIGRPPNTREGWGVSYVAKVRVTVEGVVREGIGAGHGIDADLGLAHESAIKEAETDAMKRALMTFGNPFGLALYDKEQAHVSGDNAAPEPEPVAFPGASSPRSSYSLKRDKPGRFEEVVRTMRSAGTIDDLKLFKHSIRLEVAEWPQSWRDSLQEVYEQERDRLAAVAA